MYGLNGNICYDFVGVGLTWIEITENCPSNCFEVFLSEKRLHGDFLKGGYGRGGFDTAVRGTMFVRNGTVTPEPSRKCNITWVVKGRPKPAQHLHDSTVAGRTPKTHHNELPETHRDSLRPSETHRDFFFVSKQDYTETHRDSPRLTETC